MNSTRRKVLAQLAGLGVGVLAPLESPLVRGQPPMLARQRPQFEGVQGENLSARMWAGALGDGKADDTAALQNWINHLVAHRERGILGAGTYRISAPLVIPAGNGWAIDGDIAGGTRIVQSGDNMPILDIGPNSAQPLMHSWRISNIEFDYANVQPAENKDACAILFSQMVCEFSLRGLRFARGSYAIKVKPGIGGPWGGVWDELVFESGLTGGAMQWTGCLNGVPNNKWGRFFVDCSNMTGPVFEDVRGYNWVVGTIEYIAARQGAQLLSISAGSICSIEALKLENGVYRDAKDLIAIGAGAHVRIGQFYIGGNAMILHPRHGAVNLFATSIGGPTGSFELDILVANGTEIGGDVFVINGSKGDMRVKEVSFDSNQWQLCDNRASTTGDTLTVDQYRNDRISRDLGDVDYIVHVGAPNVLSFETAFTAPRVLDLPSQVNNMFNGLYYEIRVYGAVKGTNTLRVACGGTRLYEVRETKVVVRFDWRRDTDAANGWVMTKYEVLP
jgi:hypothetical protein